MHLQTKPNRSIVAEIIGPAGAGKTSLSQLLRSGNEVRAGLSVWRLPFPLLAESLFSSFPKLISLLSIRRQLTWEDAKLVIQLNALVRLLKRESAKGYRALLQDEGTVFALAKLDAFGQESPPHRSQGWMKSFLTRLDPQLDAVIWLDAPNSVLARRIRERDKPHRVKQKSDAEIEEHLARYRSSFERVLAEFNRREGVRLFKFSTDQVPLEEIARTVLSQVGARA